MDMLSLASQQHNLLRQRILSDDPTIDEVTLADTLEGLTDLHEMLAAVIRAVVLDEALAAGLASRIGEMQSRHERLQERAVNRRAIARDVMGRSRDQENHSAGLYGVDAAGIALPRSRG